LNRRARKQNVQSRIISPVKKVPEGPVPLVVDQFDVACAFFFLPLCENVLGSIVTSKLT
jgi:hypothetical protein